MVTFLLQIDPDKPTSAPMGNTAIREIEKVNPAPVTRRERRALYKQEGGSLKENSSSGKELASSSNCGTDHSKGLKMNSIASISSDENC